ncbi:hypothetical protein FB45DRAFT_1056375 [Roridomyces roridus]|uniref:Protein kinase domain-containing protein n=1 Tax=Roridomyces roridus TaxID=1738132 RepID=A0AAD7C2K5_9AGAR|nr:hypothetical protein FB45DRAFT_1056375 [Roridomyces roridus]
MLSDHKLDSSEKYYWLDRREFLLRCGYRFRSLTGPKRKKYEKKRAREQRPDMMPFAQRILDGRDVTLKVISSTLHPFEADIGQLFSSLEHAGNPRNHCVPILDVLQDPDDMDRQIIVLPQLVPFHYPAFDTVGEVVDCFRQIFEGLQYMHENFVAHRNCGLANILQDPTNLFPDGLHPIAALCGRRTRKLTRTQCWPRYYLSDLSLSRQYDPTSGKLPFEEFQGPLDMATSPPEYDYVGCNPFPTDIYLLGDVLKRHFLFAQSTSPSRSSSGIYPPLRFLGPLVDEMTRMDPASRPTIDQVVQRFDELTSQLSWRHLRQPGQRCRWPARLAQRLRQLWRIVTAVPALPPYAPPPSARMDASMRAFYTQTDQEAVYR